MDILEIKKHYLRVLVVDVDDACATAAVVEANDRCEKAPARVHVLAAEKERRERERGETVAGECSGRQGFVSLSVGNQVSGPVGRPLSISVLLAIYNTRRAARASLSRALALLASFLSIRLLSSVPSCCNSGILSFLPFT